MSINSSGYLWWSVFGALPALIWFYPLCAMEISGYESLAFLWLSPLLTFIGPIRRGVSTPTGLMLLRILTLIGVVSFQAPTTLSRLILLAVGNSFALLTLCASWWNMSKLDRYICCMRVQQGQSAREHMLHDWIRV